MTWLLIFLYVVFMIILCGNAEAADTVTAAGWYNPVALEWFCGIAACVVLGVSALVLATGTDKEPTYRIREVYGKWAGEDQIHYITESRGKYWGWNKRHVTKYIEYSHDFIRGAVHNDTNKVASKQIHYFDRKGSFHSLKE